MNNKYNSHIPEPGMKFGKLITLHNIGKRNSHIYWMCLCDCGNERRIKRLHLLEDKDTACWKCIKQTNVENILCNSVIVPFDELVNQ